MSHTDGAGFEAAFERGFFAQSHALAGLRKMIRGVIVLAVFAARIDEFDGDRKPSDFRRLGRSNCFISVFDGWGGQRAVRRAGTANLRSEIREAQPSSHENGEEDGKRQEFIYDQKRMCVA